MRHYILLLLMAFCMPFALSGQKLHVDKVLDGRYCKHPQTTDVVYSGIHLFDLPIAYYHSLTVFDDAQMMDAVADAVASDEPQAAEKEVTRVGKHIFFCFLRMKPVDDESRFIIFKDMRYAPSGKKRQVTLIYMEGECSSAQIRKMFRTSK